VAPEWDWHTWLILAGRGAGKALALDTPLPTPAGWTQMGQVAPGDNLFDEAGRICTVTAVFDVPSPRKSFRLTFSDGSQIDACADHLWVTWTHPDRKAFLRSIHETERHLPPRDWPVWKPVRVLGRGTVHKAEAVEKMRQLRALGFSDRKIARDIRVCRQSVAAHLSGKASWQGKRVAGEDAGPRVRSTERIVDTLRQGKRGDLNHSIPVTLPLDLPEVPLPVAPYTLGAWLGDGDSKAAVITTCDFDILKKIEADGYSVGKGKFGSSGRAGRFAIGAKEFVRAANTGRMASNGSLHSKLRELGVLRNKHVPARYLRASIEQRLELLRGLMDTDGSAAASNVEFVTTRKALADGVAELARSLGQKPIKSPGMAKLQGRSISEKWRITWRPTLEVFSLSRKLRQIRLGAAAQMHRNHHRMIVSAVTIESKPMRCITVNSHYNLFLAGEAMIPTHNTRCGAEWVRRCVCGPTPLGGGSYARIALVAETAADARDVIVEGPSGLLAIHPPGFSPKFEQSKRRLTWPNGAVAMIYNATEPDQLRGPQHEAAWCDELAKWRYAQETWDMLQFGLRLGAHPRQVITTTPRPIPLIRDFLAREGQGVAITRGSTYDNRANLAASFFKTIVKRYEATRLGRQELNAEILDDMPGALWTRAMLDASRVASAALPQMQRIVIGVDPAAKASARGDKTSETGIVVAGLGEDGQGYVLDDLSCRLSPAGWARKVAAAFDRYSANAIVVEINQGGAMVETVLRAERAGLPLRQVRASHGKTARAEPIAALYEQGRVSHAGAFAALEDQMVLFTPFGIEGDGAADRVDALVWALSDLFPRMVKPPADVSWEDERGGGAGSWLL
jgi:predicted phage terminase large subunit-like protein